MCELLSALPTWGEPYQGPIVSDPTEWQILPQARLRGIAKSPSGPRISVYKLLTSGCRDEQLQFPPPGLKPETAPQQIPPYKTT